MKQWYDVSVNEFQNYISELTFSKYKKPANEHKELIDPPMSEIYWALARANQYLPPTQNAFIQAVSEKCEQEDTNALRFRVGYRTYGAFVRQHHFAICLAEELGKTNLISGPALDACYGVDILAIDQSKRVHAVHLSTNTNTAKSYARKEFKVSAFKNHDIRLDFSSALRLGKGEQFLLHPIEDVISLVKEIETDVCLAPA